MAFGVGRWLQRVVGAAVLSSFGPVVAWADVNSCVDIDNDLVRLQCYDAALNRGDGVARSPEEAYDNLLQTLAYSSDLVDVTMYYIGEPCHVQVTVRQLRRINGGYTDALLVISDVNFANVERVGRWRPFFSLGSDYPKALTLNYARGTEGSWTSWQRRAQFSASYTAAELGPGVLEQPNNYQGRDAMIVLLPEEIAVDQQPVAAAVRGMIRACNS